jgi:adenylosuccinate lyase
LETNDTIIAVAGVFDLELKNNNAAENKQALIEQINYLILHDFNRLISILYRLDVNESRINALLKEHAGSDAAEIIAALMIERELQRARTRQQFKQNENNQNDEERW